MKNVIQLVQYLSRWYQVHAMLLDYKPLYPLSIVFILNIVTYYYYNNALFGDCHE